MEKDPTISTGKFINNRDPMVSTGDKKKDILSFFKIIKKNMAV